MACLPAFPPPRNPARRAQQLVLPLALLAQLGRAHGVAAQIQRHFGSLAEALEGKGARALAMHALSAKSYRLDDSRGQRLKRACDKSIIDENEHVFVYMVRYMPAGAISFDIVLAGIFYFRMLSTRASNPERAIAVLYELK